VNLREWALSQGLHPQTAYKWFREGKLPVPARKMGKLILVGDLAGSPAQHHGRTVVYARVPSADQKPDLDRRVARVTGWATEHGYEIAQVVTEVSSALDGKRRKFLALLGDPTATVIMVEHRDRFARFGAEYVSAALQAAGRRLVVVDNSDLDPRVTRL
jgi:putative resolvase